MLHVRKPVHNYRFLNPIYGINCVHEDKYNKREKNTSISNIFTKNKKLYFYIYKTKNFTLSFTKHLVVKNGFVYMLLENIVFLNYLINKYYFQIFFSFVRLKKDIIQVSAKSNKKNGNTLYTFRRYKSTFETI